MWTSNPPNIVRTKLSVALQIKSNMWVSFFLFALEHNFSIDKPTRCGKKDIHLCALWGLQNEIRSIPKTDKGYLMQQENLQQNVP